MAMLPDGTIIPSFLGTKSTGRLGNIGNQTNLSLRQGEVMDIVYPGDKRNLSKKQVEYVVRVVVKDGNGSATQVNYNAVQVDTLFGGIADLLTYTFRTRLANDAPKPGQLGLGSKVLLLCINGDTPQAVIMGGLRDLANMQGVGSVDSNLGHNLAFQFNGVNVVIDKNGQLSIAKRGATNADGTLVEENSEPSTVLFDSSGNIALKMPAQCSIQAKQGVVVGAGTNKWMLGTVYRQNENAMNTTISDIATEMANLMTAASTAFTSAAVFMQTPVVGASLAAVPMLTAATALTNMVALFTSWAESINIFENSANAYLSTLNTND